MILNFLKFNIVVLNLIVIIWTNLCFNSYRLEIENTFQVPDNLQYNRTFFLMILNCFISALSMLTVIFNMGREVEYKLYYGINFIAVTSLGIYDYIEYDNCDHTCRDLLGRHNLYDADTLARYLSLFYLIMTIDYICLGLFYLLNRITENPIQLNSLYAEQLTQTETPTDMRSPVENGVNGQLAFTSKRIAFL